MRKEFVPKREARVWLIESLCPPMPMFGSPNRQRRTFDTSKKPVRHKTGSMFKKPSTKGVTERCPERTSRMLDRRSS